MIRSGSAVRSSWFSKSAWGRSRRFEVVAAATLVVFGVVPAFGVVEAHAQGSPATSAKQKATAAAPAPAGLDHFLCYTAKGTGFRVPASVGLINQFSPAPGITRGLLSADLHCNPTLKIAKTGNAKISNPNADLLCWGVRNPLGIGTTTVQVTNQFGTALLQVNPATPNQLCLPSWKSLKGVPNKKPPTPPGLSHFACYAVRYVPGTAPFKPPAVHVQDQFSPRLVAVTVGAPQELCLPTTKIVGKTVYQMQNPTLHLLCFAVSPTPRKTPVFDENQFGQGPVSIVKTSTLCLPSTKIVVPPTPTLSTHLNCGETSQITTPGPCTLGDQVNGVINDLVTVTGTGAGGDPLANGGSVSFVLCGPTPTQTPCTTPTTGGFSGCQTPVPNGCLVNIYANSGGNPITAPGWYCAHVTYSGNANYAATSDNDTTTECVHFGLPTPTLTTHLTCGETSQTTTPGPCTLGDRVNGIINDQVVLTGTPAGGNPISGGGTSYFVLCGPTPTQTPCTATVPTSVPFCQVAIANGCAWNYYMNANSPIVKAGWYCDNVSYSGNANYAPVSDNDPTTECVFFPGATGGSGGSGIA